MELVLNLKSFAQLLKLVHLMKLNVGMVLVQKTFLNVPKYLLKWIRLALEIHHLDAQMDLAETTDWIAQHSITVLKIHLFFVMTELVKKMYNNVFHHNVYSVKKGALTVLVLELLVVHQSHAQNLLHIYVQITLVKKILRIVLLNHTVLLKDQFVALIILVWNSEWLVTKSLMNVLVINQ